MHRYFLFLLFLCLAMTLTAQEPVQLTDRTDGVSTFPDRVTHATLNGLAVVVAGAEATGLEPYALTEDGDLVLLADTEPGADDGNVRSLTPAMDRLFFTSQSATGQGRVWSTDGTPAGTRTEFGNAGDPEGTVSPLVVGGDGAVYFTVDEQLYRITGTGVDSLGMTGRYAPGSSTQNTISAMGAYQQGVAYVSKEGGFDRQLLLRYAADSVSLLDTIDDRGLSTFFVEGSFVREVPGGAVFSIVGANTDSDLSGNYFYRAAADSVELFGGPLLDDLYIINDSTEVFAAYSAGTNVLEDRYYAIDSVGATPEVVLDGVAYSSPSLNGRNPSTDGERVYWMANFGFGNYDLHVSDGTVAGTRVLYTGNFRESRFSNVIGRGPRYRLFANGTAGSSFNRLTFYLLDLTTDELTTIWTGPEGVPIGESVTLLQVAGDQVYFTWNAGEGEGKQLYRLMIPINTNGLPNSVRPTELDVLVTAETFTVRSERQEPVEVMIFSADGRQLASLQTTTNSATDLRRLPGIHVYVFRVGDRFGVRRIVTTR